jgi:Skp family chaperone for outer membrane proteins
MAGGVALFRVLVFGLVLALSLPVTAGAQSLGRVISPILTIDRERLFSESAFGRRVNRELEAASSAMAAETRRIEAALEEEELRLTEQRETMEPEAFRELAREFDEKVQSLRREREMAEDNLRRQIEAAQAEFFERVGPILGEIVRERGAVLIIDRRAILLTAADIDITDDAIARSDSVLGDGDNTAPAPVEPEVDPEAPLDIIPAPAAPAEE